MIYRKKQSKNNRLIIVLQWSIPVPLLFIAYVNDLHEVLKIYVMFPYDTNLFCSKNNKTTLFQKDNSKLNKSNKILINADKSKYMIFDESCNTSLRSPVLLINNH